MSITEMSTGTQKQNQITPWSKFIIESNLKPSQCSSLVDTHLQSSIKHQPDKTRPILKPEYRQCPNYYNQST